MSWWGRSEGLGLSCGVTLRLLCDSLPPGVLQAEARRSEALVDAAKVASFAAAKGAEIDRFRGELDAVLAAAQGAAREQARRRRAAADAAEAAAKFLDSAEDDVAGGGLLGGESFESSADEEGGDVDDYY